MIFVLSDGDYILTDGADEEEAELCDLSEGLNLVLLWKDDDGDVSAETIKGIEVDRPVIAFDSETPPDPTSAYVVAITGTFDPATVENVSNWELKFNDVKQDIDSVSLSKDTVVISFEKYAEVGDIVFIQALAAAFSDYHTDSNVISYEVAK